MSKIKDICGIVLIVIVFLLISPFLLYLCIAHKNDIRRKCRDCGHVYEYEWKKCNHKYNCERCNSTNLKRGFFGF